MTDKEKLTDIQKLRAKRSALIDALEVADLDKVATITYLIQEINIIIKNM